MVFSQPCGGLLVLLGSLVLVGVSTAPHRDILTKLLRADLNRGEDLAHLLSLKCLSELVTVRENKVLPELAEESGIGEAVVRRNMPLSQRERKAGCRNFFWKTFTSC